ncbi:Putative E3 ubiquitin-protein ligase LIN-1, partial [Linum perenne]
LAGTTSHGPVVVFCFQYNHLSHLSDCITQLASMDSSSSVHLPDIESTKAVVGLISDHIHQLLSSPESWISLKLSCVSMLNVQKKKKDEFFEFSDHSVISSLYWGVEAIESAIQSEGIEGRTAWLEKSESMLQVPALLEEDGVTAGIQNRCLICCSYFYLSVVKRLQGDDLQVALHFFQALMVSPRLVRVEFAPRVCEELFHLTNSISDNGSLWEDSSESCVDKAVRDAAERCKHRLMYYQVMMYGESQSFRQVKVHPLDDDDDESRILQEIEELEDYNHPPRHFDRFNMFKGKNYLLRKKNTSTRSLQQVLMESDSDTETSVSSCCKYHLKQEETIKEAISSPYEVHNQNLPFPRLVKENKPRFSSGGLVCSIGHKDLSIFEQLSDRKTDTLLSYHVKDDHGITTMDDLRRAATTTTKNEKTKNNKKLHSARDFSSLLSLHPGQASETELVVSLEKAISRLCFSEGVSTDEEEVTTIYEILNRKRGVKYKMLKNVILDQLLVAISTSKEERVIRASVSILSTIVSVNKSAVEEIKRKGLQLLQDLATALKSSKVHEAAILIYLINPSPTEIKTLELLPALVEVVCVYKEKKPERSLLVTPPAASLMIMEVLVTAFDCDTNNTHLASIVSPQVLGRLVEVVKDRNLEEHVSLARILVKCMNFDGYCRRYISESIPLEPFTFLLQRREKSAKLAALEFFHEILCIPRSSAIRLLQRIQKGIGSNHMQMLMDLVHELQTDHQLLAANLLLQLDNLENSSSKSKFSDDALEIILEGLSNEHSTSQQLSAFLLANIGGTYAWSGEPYTVAWLVKKGGLNSLTHRNLIKNFNQLDQTLQDSGIDPWCGRITKRVLDTGKPVFQALARGLRSKTRKVRLNSLTAIAWIGCEIGKYPNSTRHSACEILLSELEHFLHPGLDLEERFLACMCIYNYASGKGMQKLINFSEGVRESLRRLSSVTWMAEELHRVADYYLPNRSVKQRISCVHTQVLEAKHGSSGAVTAIIYYKGFLFSGYSDGTVKGWDIKDQNATVASEAKEHRKVVTCFSLFEEGESLLSGSADKTIRVK